MTHAGGAACIICVCVVGCVVGEELGTYARARYRSRLALKKQVRALDAAGLRGWCRDRFGAACTGREDARRAAERRLAELRDLFTVNWAFISYDVNG